VESPHLPRNRTIGPPGRAVSRPSGTLVVVNLVGGLDGLSVVVPHGDPAYAARRPGLAVAAPGERYGAIDLGRGLGLHPSLAPLQNCVGRSERLAFIGGVGVPDRQGGDRNHLPCREFLHRGGRGQTEGWAARLLRFEELNGDATWSFGDGPHPVFEGLHPEASAPTKRVSVGRRHDQGRADWGHSESNGENELDATGPVTHGSAVRWSDTDWSSPAARLSRGYPEGRLGRSLAATADRIREDRGLRIVAIDHPGYDTHVDQGDGRSGVLAHRLDRLSRALVAFWGDILAGRERAADDNRTGQPNPVTVVVVSEFGRAIEENGSGGTEHGRGGVAFALGDQVVGGIHGDFPSVAHGEVLPVTVDIRRVIADAAASHGFRPWRGGIFPRLALPNRSLGLLLSP